MPTETGFDTTSTAGRLGGWVHVLLVAGMVAVLVAAPAIAATGGGPAAVTGTPSVGGANGTVDAGNDTVDSSANTTANATNDTDRPPVEFWSAPADQEPETKTQPDGTTFEARQWGNAFRNGWETTDNYTVRQNESGWWHYAREDDGSLVATDRRVGVESPSGLPAHARPEAPSEPQLAAQQDSAGTSSTVEPSPSSGPGQTDVSIPIVFANFADTEPDYTTESFADLYFGTNPDEATGPGSFREYFLEASGGRVNFTAGPGVIGWLDTSFTHDEAGADIPAAREYAAEAVRNADRTTNFSKYDYDGDGAVRVAVIHPGPGQEVTGDSTDIWSHRWGFYGGIQTDDGVTVTGYSLQPETDPSGDQNTIGVVAHETGHLIFDWPDLYPTGETPGIDNWGLMGSGSYGTVTQSGDSPVHPIAWTKREAGWTTTTRIAPADQPGILPPSSAENEFYRIGDDSATSGRHFLLSYRALDGFDRGLDRWFKNPGLLVWNTSNAGVSDGGDLTHSYYRGTGGSFDAADCADCRGAVSLTNITRSHDSIVFNDPPRRALEAGESAVYAVPVNRTLPDGRTVGDAWRLSSRVSWAENSSDLDLSLTSPDGSQTLLSSATETSYEGVRTARTPASGGWKLVQTADASVDYYSATTYPTLPLPTAVTANATDADAGSTDAPETVTVNVSVYSGGQLYETGAFDQLNASSFEVTVDGEIVETANVSVTGDAAGAYTLTITPPERSAGGTVDLAVTVTDTKVGVTHRTNVSTTAVTYDGSNGAPTAAVSANRTTVAVGEPVQFDAKESADSDGSVASYAWTFGDGGTATGSQPAHAFSSNGTYTVELTTTDDDGATDNATVTVEVVEPNDSPTTAVSANRTSIEAGEAVTFDATGSTDTDGSIASYEWAFGDGSTATGAQPSHTFSSAGSYTVELTVTDDDGAADNATVTVEVTDPNEPPDASVSANRTSANAGETIAFDATGSTDTDGSIASYEWAFGDESTATGAQPSHTFSSAGSYTVDVTVTDDDGATDNATVTVKISEPNQSPNAVVSANRTTVGVGEPVAFDASESSDPDGPIAASDWTFGDGNGSASQQPVHEYASAGTYTVELTVTDDDGATDNTTVEITVAEPNEAPDAYATANRTTVTVGETVAFDASVSSDTDGSIASHEWVFGDGTTATGPQPIHVFASNGTYTVELTVTDADGTTNTTTVSVAVTATGDAGGNDDDSDGGNDDGGSDGGNDSGSDGGNNDGGSDDGNDSGSDGGNDDGGSDGGNDDGSDGGNDDSGSDGGNDDGGSPGGSLGGGNDDSAGGVGGGDTDEDSSDSGDTDDGNATNGDVSVTVDDADPTTGEMVNVTLNVSDVAPENGSMAVVWTRDNRTVDRNMVEMASGESGTVTLSRSFTSPGEYELMFANRTAGAVSVGPARASEPSEAAESPGVQSTATTPSPTATVSPTPTNATATTSGSGPGFGVVGALVAVLVVGWRRR